MMPPRRDKPQEDSVDSWLMSYADLITLLMCFFIIFVSVSEPKREKFTEITKGIMDKFGAVDTSTPFAGAYNDLQYTIEENQVFRDVAVKQTPKNLEIEISSNRFFSGNTAQLDEESRAILENMAQSLKTLSFLDYKILVVSHTSNLPPANPIYPTNWELSTARAARVVRFLIEQGLPADRMRAIGYADTQPAVPNNDLQNNPIPENQEKNERVLIQLERQ